MRKPIHIIVFILLVASNLKAGDKLSGDTLYNKTGFWIGAGLGGNYFGPTLCVNLSYKIEQNLITIKYASSEEFQFGVDNTNLDKPSIGMNEFGLLYGRCFRNKILLLSVSAGLSFINGTNRGKNISDHKFEEVKISTLGIPFEAEAMFEFSNYVGIGLLFYGNLNKDRSFGGGMLRIKVGSF